MPVRELWGVRGRWVGGVLSVGLGVCLYAPAPAPAQARDAFVGEVMWFAGGFCPQGWANADGQVLEISKNTALFSILGTTYGGDGRTTFALPDLRGRVAVHAGQGSGLGARTLGESGGTETETVTLAQIPAHEVAQLSTSSSAETTEGVALPPLVRRPAAGGSPAPRVSTVSVGEGQAHNNLPPYQVLLACIAVEGVYPSRP